MSKLIEQLETLPSFAAFKKAVSEKLNQDNFYVKEFAPAKNLVVDGVHITNSNDYVEDMAIDGLVDDNTGYFSEFVTEELGNETIELIRSIIKEMRNA